MIPKFRAWYKKGTLPMLKVHLISFDQQFIDAYIDDEAVAETEMSFDFDDVIIMQSTGLFDSSLEPVEIYKDDIVTKSLPNGAVLVGVVTFTKGMFLVDGVEAIDQSWVVIGNIHEHPQLLEGLSDG